MADSVLKLPKLRGSSNYEIWAIKIESVLIEKGLYSYITDSDLSSNIITPEQRNESLKATSLIRLSLEDGPLLQTKHILNPYDLWEVLKTLYMAKGFSSNFILCKELINTTLTSSKNNIENYINNFHRLVNSLNSKSIKLPKQFLVSLLLNNLNSKDYEYLVATITQSIRLQENQEEIDLDEIVSQLLDESRRLSSIKAYKNNPNSYNNSYNRNSYYNQSKFQESTDIEMAMNTKANYKPTLCNYCDKKGHLEDSCYSKKRNNQNKVKNTLYNQNRDQNTIYNPIIKIGRAHV